MYKILQFIVIEEYHLLHVTMLSAIYEGCD